MNSKNDRSLFVGKHTSELPSPALIIDLDSVETNINNMQMFADKHKVGLRPHIKTHKSTYIAKKQLDAGAIGVCCATIDEVEAMAEAKIPSILLTNVIVTDDKIKRFTSLIRNHEKCEFIAAIDSTFGLERFAHFANRENVKINLVVEFDTGAKRCGIPTVEAAIEIIDQIHGQSNLNYAGITTYNGSISLETDRKKQNEMAMNAYKLIEKLCEKIEAKGYDLGIVSTAGTGDYELFATYPFITEIQPGSYVYSDLTYINSLQKDFSIAMRILATSISKPSANTCIFDAGFKWISFEFGLPQLVGGEQVKINMKGDEHISVEYPPEFPSLNIGDKAFFYTTHVCTTNNLYTFAYGVRKDIVECIFEIDAK